MKCATRRSPAARFLWESKEDASRSTGEGVVFYMHAIDIQPYQQDSGAFATLSWSDAHSVPVHQAPTSWRPTSWRSHPALQQPDWPDRLAVERVTNELSRLPALVPPAEILHLQRSLAAVASGRAFLLQAGDCAERFESCTEQSVRSKLRVILQLAILLTYGSGLPVVKVGRIAGQFAKPRSKPSELVDGIELPVFRGDIVNSLEPTLHARRPDADRLLRAYHYASATLDILRALTKEGFASLCQIHAWNEEFVRRSPAGWLYEKVADEITWALRFMSASGVDLAGLQALHQVHLYTSHEALLLRFEQALT